jgi:hypothetical protein
MIAASRCVPAAGRNGGEDPQDLGPVARLGEFIAQLKGPARILPMRVPGTPASAKTDATAGHRARPPLSAASVCTQDDLSPQ